MSQATACDPSLSLVQGRDGSNYQDGMKCLALLAMILDHLGYFFFPEQAMFQVMGRTAMPIFCFFAGYNYRAGVRLSLLVWGVALQLLSVYWEQGVWYSANILLTIFIGQLYLRYVFVRWQASWQCILQGEILLCLWPLTEVGFQYGTLAVTVMMCGAIAKRSVSLQCSMAVVVMVMSWIHAMVHFDASDTLVGGGMAATIGLVGLGLARVPYDKPILLPLRPITRHALSIFVGHWLGMEIVWRVFI